MSTATDLQASPQNTQQVAVAAKDASESPEWQRILKEAEKLAAAPLTPIHLKVLPSSLTGVPEADRRKVAWGQTVANCILVANQARRWQADVFAVAAETYVVGNKLGYQGKLIAAIVNTRASLAQSLRPCYSTGKGDAFAAVIYGKKEGDIPAEAFPLLERYADDEDRKALRELDKLGVLAVRVSVGQAKTNNKIWHTDPEQKLWYTGATKWARRFAPEVTLGILTNDDLDYMRDRVADEPERGQSRIGQVIPATLDASGVLPEIPPAVHDDANQKPGALEPEVIQPEPEERVQPDPEPVAISDEDRATEIVEQYRVRLEGTDSVIECNNMAKEAETFAASELWFDGEPVEAVKAMARTRADQIRGSRGQKGGAGR